MLDEQCGAVIMRAIFLQIPTTATPEFCCAWTLQLCIQYNITLDCVIATPTYKYANAFEAT